jgi:hypothetical protein
MFEPHPTCRYGSWLPAAVTVGRNIRENGSVFRPMSGSYERPDETGQHDEDETSQQSHYSGSYQNRWRQPADAPHCCVRSSLDVTDEAPDTWDTSGGPYKHHTTDAADQTIGHPAEAAAAHPAAKRSSRGCAAEELDDQQYAAGKLWHGETPRDSALHLDL